MDMAQGHGAVLAVHLMKLLKSSKKIIHLMTKAFDDLKNIECVRYINQQLLYSPQELEPHLFPFLYSGAEGELSTLYRNVKLAMTGTQKADKLAQLWWVAHTSLHTYW